MVSLNIQEREEQRALNRGMGRSIWGFLLCWVPLVGLLLSVTGFLKVAVRVTQQHRTRYIAFFTLTFIIMALNIGAITGGLWVFTQRPEWVQDAKTKILSALQLNDYLNPAPPVNEGSYNEGGYYEGNSNEGEYIDPNSPDGMKLYDDMQYDENGNQIDAGNTDILDDSMDTTIDGNIGSGKESAIEGEISKDGESEVPSEPISKPDIIIAKPGH